MNALALVSQLGGVVLAVALAPLLTGWVAQCRAWLQNRSAPSLLLPYRTLRKLFRKDAALATHASPLFRAAQTGFTQNYALVMVLGLMVAVLLFFVRDIF